MGAEHLCVWVRVSIAVTDIIKNHLILNNNLP